MWITVCSIYSFLHCYTDVIFSSLCSSVLWYTTVYFKSRKDFFSQQVVNEGTVQFHSGYFLHPPTTCLQCTTACIRVMELVTWITFNLFNINIQLVWRHVLMINHCYWKRDGKMKMELKANASRIDYCMNNMTKHLDCPVHKQRHTDFWWHRHVYWHNYWLSRHKLKGFSLLRYKLKGFSGTCRLYIVWGCFVRIVSRNALPVLKMFRMIGDDVPMQLRRSVSWHTDPFVLVPGPDAQITHR